MVRQKLEMRLYLPFFPPDARLLCPSLNACPYLNLESQSTLDFPGSKILFTRLVNKAVVVNLPAPQNEAEFEISARASRKQHQRIGPTDWVR